MPYLGIARGRTSHYGIVRYLIDPPSRPPLAALEALLRSSSSLPAPGRADRKRRAPPSTAASTTPTTAPAASSEGEGRLLLLLRRQVAKGEAAGRRVGREVLVLVLLLTKVRLEDLHRLRGG